MNKTVLSKLSGTPHQRYFTLETPGYFSPTGLPTQKLEKLVWFRKSAFTKMFRIELNSFGLKIPKFSEFHQQYACISFLNNDPSMSRGS